MKILALDTSTEVCSVALYNDGEITQSYHHQPQQQAKLLLPECERLLSGSQMPLSAVDAIAFCSGPGSFTGLRVAVSAAQGMAMSQDKPLLSLSSLLTLAYGAYRRSGESSLQVAACLDARMNEVYHGAYSFENKAYKILSPDQVIKPELLQHQSEQGECLLEGNGWHVYQDKLTFDIEVLDAAIHWPEAQDLAVLACAEFEAGNLLLPEEALPVYLRNNVALKKSER